MSKNKIFLFCLLFVMVAPSLFSRGLSEKKQADWDTVKNGEKVQVSGHIRLVGNAPFSQFILTDETGRDWYFDQENPIPLNSFDQSEITVKGTARIKEMVLADGSKQEPRRILTDLEIISE